ncbi:MAG: DUF4835 family protein [Ignavibacteria bacterium]|nr:DUF4835 family protein [Ignavibacteria bacterium]
MKNILFFFLFASVINFAQELEATVTINKEQLTLKYKDLVADFSNTVETYLNTTSFTETAWEGEKIKCNFNVFFVNGSDEVNYSAHVVITSQRDVYNSSSKSLMLSIMDDSWKFRYEPRQTMRFDPLNFDPLTSFLDFYAYLIIGYELDSYKEFSGSEMYQKAYNLAILGNNSEYKKGWELDRSSYNKRGLLDEMMGEKYSQVRDDFFNYHYNGLDLLADERETGIKNIKKMLNNILENQPKYTRSVFLKVFFDAKNGELIEIFRKENDPEIFELLRKIDPAHISKYNEATSN